MASTCTYIHVYVQTHVSMYDPHIYIPTLTHTSETGGAKKREGRRRAGSRVGERDRGTEKQGLEGNKEVRKRSSFFQDISRVYPLSSIVSGPVFLCYHFLFLVNVRIKSPRINPGFIF